MEKHNLGENLNASKARYFKLIFLFFIFFVVSTYGTIAQINEENHIDIQAEKIMGQLYSAKSGDEFNEILDKVEDNQALKVAVMEKMSQNIERYQAQFFIPDGKINLRFEDDGKIGPSTYFVIDEDETISDFRTGIYVDEAFDVVVEEKLLQEIKKSDDVVSEMTEAVESKKISFETDSFSEKIKVVTFRFISALYTIYERFFN